MKKPTHKMKALLGLAMLWLTSLAATAQVTTTFEAGPDWVDVTIIEGYSTGPGSPTMQVDTSYPNYQQLAATRHSSAPDEKKRSLLRINIAHLIPVGTVLQSAKLVLTNYGTTTSPWGDTGNSGSNATYIQRVTQAWSLPAWNTQPTTTTTGQVAIPAYTGANGTQVEVDVTSMVQDMVNNPATNFGFMLKLQSESGSKARNFGSCDMASPLSRPKLVVVTAQPIPPIPERDYIFGNLSQTQITSGILTDFGYDLSDPTLYDGVIRPDNEMNIDSWRALYAEFLTSVINPNSNLKSLKVINDTLDNKWRSTIQNDNRVIDVPVQFVRYQSLVSNASPSMITISNNQLHDVPNRTQNPYATKYAFAAAPTMPYDLDGTVDFRFPAAVFINSSDKTMTNFSVDFDDGLGYRTVTVGNNVITVEYSSTGTKTLRYKFTVNGGTIYYSHSKFQVYGAAIQARYSEVGQSFKFPRATDNRCPEPSFANPEQYQGSFAGAKVTISYGDIGSRPVLTCTPQLIRPLIVVEGYDVSRFSAFGMDNWDYEQFIITDRNGGIRAATSEGDDLNGRLSAGGYDIVFVDLYDGTGDIIRNAYLLENIIKWVNSRKINNPVTGLREQTVLLGQSMGGLIARYAVCDMEKRKIANSSYPAHEVRLLVTQDSPHRGANVPQGFQSLINKIATQNMGTIGLVNYGTTGAIVGSQLDIQDVVPAIKQGKQLLNEPATRQMLLIQDGLTNSFLNGDYRTMITFNTGYTPTFSSVALANGSECGQGQIINPSEELFYANASLYVSPLLFIPAADLITSTAISPVQRGLGSLTDVPFHLLIPFSGKTWKTRLEVNSTDVLGSGQVFSGKLAMEKKILAIIPLNITMFDQSTTVSNTGHWDSRPGGYYNLQSKTARISGQNINAYPILEARLTLRVAKLFNFVPTVSALDISTTPLTTPAITSEYTNGSNTTYPSRFGNFKTQERDMGVAEVLHNSRYNSRHVQFTATNTTWLLNVLRGLNPHVSCSYSCNGGSGATMAGATQLCSSPGVYTLSNIPPSATISWFSTGSISVPPNSSGTTVTATPVGASGTAVVGASFITPNCGNTETRKTLTIGNPAWPRESTNNDGSPSYINIGPNPLVYTNTPTTIFWNDYPAKTGPIAVYSQGNVISSGEGSVYVSYPTAGTYTVSAEAPASCGYVSVNQIVTVVSGSGLRIAESDYVYYPNPANEKLTITKQPVEDLQTKSMTGQEPRGVTTVKLVDSTGNMVASRNVSESGITFDTTELPSGLYHLILSAGGRTYRQQIVVKH